MLSGTTISRQASSSELASLSLSTTLTSSPEKNKHSKAAQKAARSKRCKSLLMLSSPFSSSTTSSMKMSLLSLLHPNQNQHESLQDLCLNKQQQQHNRLDQHNQNNNNSSSSTDEENYSTQSDYNLQESISCSPAINSSNFKFRNNTQQQTTTTTTTTTRHKCVKMKLFEQPLDKLFSPKAMKQLNNLINAHYSPSFDSTLNKRKRSTSTSTACLRKFSIDLNNNNNNNNNSPSPTNSMTQAQRQQLLHSVIPEPIKNLLNELYIRGPSTVGIFRKSPNAKHCRELRQKLEADSLSSIKQFQVTVIASVFKEWLRSLPDCLLMSRLYPQWVDVAKLIEPLYHHHHQQQQQLQLQQQEQEHQQEKQQQQQVQHQQVHLQRHQSQSTLLDSSLLYGDNSVNGNTSLRPSRSPLTDNSQIQLLDRAHSCSTMSVDYSIKTNDKNFNACDLSSSMSDSSSNEPTPAQSSSNTTTTTSTTNSMPTMSAFALAERNSECLRIVRQLLDTLNEPNLILLRSFICVLWHIANNSEFNKMSANNLGVCVGQSLLNDEHQSTSSNKSSTNSTFTKRHRRTRSQCILSSTLSLTNSSPLQNSGCYLNSNSAQETAKYVPILVGFMIENATALFGQDITSLFSSLSPDETTHHHHHQQQQQQQQQEEIKSLDVASRMNSSLEKENLSPSIPLDHGHEIRSFIDEVDSGSAAVDDSNQIKARNDGPIVPPTEIHDDCQPSQASMKQQQQQQHDHHYRQTQQRQQLQRQQIVVASRYQPDGYNEGLGDSECNMVNSDNTNNNNNNRSLDDDNSTTTSILIVNHHPTKRQSHVIENRHRPLSATESTSSSRASSSTSGVHSESPAFSSEVDSHNTRTTNTTSSSPSPSTVSSPSSVTSSSPTSPVQCETDSHETRNNDIGVELVGQEESTTSTRICSTNIDSQQTSHLGDTNHPDSKAAHLSECRPSVRTQSLLNNNNKQINSSLDQTANISRYQNRHMINNRYSTYMGILNRVPKIPVQLTTSNYGGEAIIYNPKPRRNSADNQQQAQQFGGVSLNSQPNLNISNQTTEQLVVDNLPVECSNRQQEDSVISVEPLAAAAIQRQREEQQHKYHSISTEAQQELREQRLNDFLAHQHHTLVSTPSLPFLPQSNNYNTIARQQQQQHNLIVSQHHQQHPSLNNIGYLQPHQQQQQQLPLFYSTTNLSSLQQHQHYQQDRYLLYHRTSLEPQRSHVMSLRDYYLSLERQNQQQQQSLMRERLHRQQQQSRLILQQQRAATINESCQTSQQQQQQLKQNEHQHILIANRQYLVDHQQPFNQQQQQQANGVSNGLTTHQAIQRPQPRLAKIRQNQFSGVYVKNISQPLPPLASLSTRTNVTNTTVTQATSSAATAPATTTVVPAGVIVASRANSNVNAVRQMSSSSDHSSDESDEYINEWMESTMV